MIRQPMLLCLTIALMTVVQAGTYAAEGSTDHHNIAERLRLDRIASRARTIGVWQHWLDVAEQAGWRIQQDPVSQTHRLIDPSHRVDVKGSWDLCRSRLDELNPQLPAELASRETVILLHGLGRTSLGMHTFAASLDRAGYRVICFNYPSTRVSIDQAAVGLRSMIASQTGNSGIHLVAHSLGGLVCRAALTGGPIDPRVKRLVMLGTPNHGAEIADRLQHVPYIHEIVGPVGVQLLTGPQSYVAQLGIPDIEFGIIAGARGDEEGYSSRVPGDDDGTVSLRSALLEGAADVLLINLWHPLLIYDKRPLQATAAFLKTGQFQRTF